MTIRPNENARKALNEMKMEIAHELNVDLNTGGRSSKSKNRKSRKIDNNNDTVNPS